MGGEGGDEQHSKRWALPPMAGPIALTMGNPKPPPLDPQPAFLLNIAGLRPAMLRRGPKARDAFTQGGPKVVTFWAIFGDRNRAKSGLGQKSTGPKVDGPKVVKMAGQKSFGQKWYLPV